jgi:hypothetical protein
MGRGDRMVGEGCSIGERGGGEQKFMILLLYNVRPFNMPYILVRTAQKLDSTDSLTSLSTS